MSLKKQYLKTKPVCRVTFKLEKKAAKNATQVFLVGDFNGWDEKNNSMRKLNSGDFTIRLDLEPGKKYQFRYLIDGEKWENDWNADGYVPTEFPGAENSILLT